MRGQPLHPRVCLYYGNIVCISLLMLLQFIRLTTLLDHSHPSFQYLGSNNKVGEDKIKDGAGGVAKFGEIGTLRENLWQQGRLCILPGELPGYTGWARPSFTLAGLFEIDEATFDRVTHAGKSWSIGISCRHKLCNNSSPLFFVRAYGPAVIPGKVTRDLGDNRNYKDYLPVVKSQEPAYEGYMLHKFPVQVNVIASQERGPNGFRASKSILCKSKQLQDLSVESALEKARWLVVEKNVQRLLPETNDTRNVTHEGYMTGINSLGIRMDYFPQNCSLLSPDNPTVEFRNIFSNCIRKTGLYSPYYGNHKFHLIFIGDSNLRMQSELINTYFQNNATNKSDKLITVTHISSSDGLYFKYKNISRHLKMLQSKATDGEHFFILFNSGLHDISTLCSKDRKKNRDVHLERRIRDGDFTCTGLYRSYLSKLIRLLLSFPARLLVFQTTTAAWPKYGNYGFAWPPHIPQKFPRDANVAHYFNKIAFEVINNSGDNKGVAVPMQNDAKIPIMDAYWITLARPDHRQVDRKQSIGKHLVHMGPEVLNALTRQWIMMILESICNEYV